MRKIFILLFLPIAILIAVVAIWKQNLLVSEKTSPDADMKIQSVLGIKESNRNFTKATGPLRFIFPRDAGPHPDFMSEWWYYTGNLKGMTGREFGYQLTIFRQAISDQIISSKSDWRTNQVYMAHFAVTDVRNKQFYSAGKMTRGAAGLAGASDSPYRIWVENWSISGDYMEPILFAKGPNFSLELSLKSAKPVVLNGNQGFSQKSTGFGNASYYYSQTRLQTKGVIQVQDRKFQVTGSSWLDREWSTSSLSENEIGWDWFSIQLDDQRELMLYQIRKNDGSTSSFSSGTVTFADGSFQSLNSDDFNVVVLDHWQSSDTGIKYPARWQVRIPGQNIDLLVTPKIENQEHQLQFIYWEGAVRIIGDGVKGDGYIELVGYK